MNKKILRGLALLNFMLWIPIAIYVLRIQPTTSQGIPEEVTAFLEVATESSTVEVVTDDTNLQNDVTQLDEVRLENLPTSTSLPIESEIISVQTVQDVELTQNSDTTIETIPPLSETVISLGVPEELEKPIDGQISIRFESGTALVDRLAYIEALGGVVIGELAQIDTIIVTVPDNITVDTMPESPIVSESEPDFPVTMLGDINIPPSDPHYPNQWALPVIGATEAWGTLPDNTPQVVVAVIDSGICAEHPDLVGRIQSGYDFVEDDNYPQDLIGHGCQVSGVIAANIDNGIGIAGIAPNAQIMPLRVLDENGVGSYSRVSMAIIYATDNGANIINLSLGGAMPSNTLQDAVNYAVSHGVTVVAAAGNTGTIDVLYPAKYDTVIAVGSITPNMEISHFSSIGNEIDVWMPGSDIWTTNIDGDYILASGTSLSSAAMSSLLALDNGYVGIEPVASATPPGIAIIDETVDTIVDFAGGIDIPVEFHQPIETAIEQATISLPPNLVPTAFRAEGDWVSIILLEPDILASNWAIPVERNNIIELVGMRSGNTWNLAVSGEPEFDETMALAPGEFIDAPTADVSAQFYALDFRFPWPRGETHYVTRGWDPTNWTNPHDPARDGSLRYAIDFNGGNGIALAASSGYARITCGGRGKDPQTSIYIQHSFGDTMYLHLDSNTVPQNIDGRYIPQGQFLGRLYDPRTRISQNPSCDGSYFYNTMCGCGTGKHFHFQLAFNPYNRPIAIQGIPILTIERGGQYTSNNVRIDAPSVAPENTNLVVNSRFNSVTTNNLPNQWVLWGQIEGRVVDGVMRVRRPADSPAGASLAQTLNYTAPANTPFQVTLLLGNPSNRPRRVDVILRHPANGRGAFSCSFTIPANSEPQEYEMQGLNSQFWRTFRVAVSLQNADGRYTLVDNVRVQVRPELNITRKRCLRPQPPQPQPELVITQTDSPDPVERGDTVTYNVTITNLGPRSASNITVMASALPAGTSLVSISTPNGSGEQCGLDVGSTSYRCNVGNLERDTSTTLQVVFNVGLDTPNTIVHDIDVTADETRLVFESSESTAIFEREQTNLTLTKTVSSAFALPGSQLSYDLTVVNNGAHTTQIIVADVLPPNINLVSIPDACTRFDGSVICEVDELAYGASVTFTLMAEINMSVVPGDVIVNSAEVSSSLIDSDLTDNTASVETTIIHATDLAIDKAVSSTTLVPNQSLVYTLSVTNNGPMAATDVVVTDALPTGLNFVSASGNCNTTAGVVTCTIGDLASGASSAVTIEATVDELARGTITNTATVTSPTQDTDDSNNIARVDATISAEANLAIIKTALSAEAVPGQNLDYLLVVTNAGSNVATNIVLTDTLPLDVSYVTATTDQGNCVQSLNTVMCNLGNLLPENSTNIHITVNVNSNSQTALINTASVESAEVDIDVSDNTATVSTAITVGSADVSISMTDNQDANIIDATPTYTITVTNNGPSVAYNVLVTDTLPAGLSFYTSSTGCSAAGNVVTCNAGTLNAFETRTLTVQVQVTGEGEQTSSASVTAAGYDPDLSNNVANHTLDTYDHRGTCTEMGQLYWDDAHLNNSLNTKHCWRYDIITTTGPYFIDIQPSTPNQNLEYYVLVRNIDTGDWIQGHPSSNLGRSVIAFSQAINGRYRVILVHKPGTNGQYNINIHNGNTVEPRRGIPNLFFTAPIPQSSYSNITRWQYWLSGQTTYNIPILRTDGDLEYTYQVVRRNNGSTIASGTSNNGNAYISLTTGGGWYDVYLTPLNGTSGSYTIDIVNGGLPPTANLGITFAGMPDRVTVGNNLNYRLSIRNSGTISATNVVVTSTLPAGVTYISATVNQGSCTEATGTIVCNLGSLAVENGVDITISTFVENAVSGSLSLTASVTASEADSAPANNSTAVNTLVNHPPELAVNPSSMITVNEGDAATQIGSVSDADGDVVSLSASIGTISNNGDGTWSWYQEMLDGPTTETVTVFADDSLGGTTEVSFTVTVNNVAPVVNAGQNQIGIEGIPIPFNGSFVDDGISDSHIVIWDFGDGTSATETLAPTHTYSDNGSYTVTLTITDSDGASGAATMLVIVENAVPTATFTASANMINEGDTLTVNFSMVNDTGITDTIYYSFDCTGDGIFEISNSLTPSATCSYADNNNYQVLGRVSDDDGAYTDYTISLTVNNVSPVVNVGEDQSVRPNQSIIISAEFTDVGLNDIHTATINYGDGSPIESGSVNQGAGYGSISGTHQYHGSPGQYIIEICVLDDDGGNSCDSFVVEIVVGPPSEPPGQTDNRSNSP